MAYLTWNRAASPTLSTELGAAADLTKVALARDWRQGPSFSLRDGADESQGHCGQTVAPILNNYCDSQDLLVLRSTAVNRI